jgi:hypothetical protein
VLELASILPEKWAFFDTFSLIAISWFTGFAWEPRELQGLPAE